MDSIIYLDNNSTTKVDEHVLQTMLSSFSENYGNASSNTHYPGILAKQAIENSRNDLASLFNAEPNEFYYNSGATEGINTILKGIFYAYKSKGNKIITSKTEHKAVLDTCEFLKQNGAEIIYLDTNKNGEIDLTQLDNYIDDTTILVALMLANNETGYIHPIKKIADIVHKKNCILFSDITQAVGKIPIDLQELGIDTACISAHKFYGPKGIGAIYLRRKKPRVKIAPLIHGGGQENGIRAGTANVPGIVGMSAAINQIKFEDNTITTLRDYLEFTLEKNVGAIILCKNQNRLPNTSNIMLPFCTNLEVLHHLKSKFAISIGSACNSANNTPSHVLKSMGLSDKYIESSIRVSLSKYNTMEEIKQFCDAIIRIFNLKTTI